MNHRRLNIDHHISYADPSSKIAAVSDTSRQCLVFVACSGYSSLAVRAFRTVKILFLMKLLTKEIISKFEKHPFHSQDGKGIDAEVLVKYFNPCGSGTWLITEAEREGDDWSLFGYCHIHEWEWGYLMLSELASLRLPFGLTIERDIYTARKYVRDFLPQDE